MAGRLVFAQGVEQDVVRLGARRDQLKALNAQALKVLKAVLGEDFASLGQELARLLVDHVIGEDAADRLIFGAPAGDAHRIGLEEAANDLRGGAEVLVQSTQEAGRDDLGALVDLDLQQILRRLLNLDPRAALGDDAAGIAATAGRTGFGREIDTGRTLDLRDDRTLSTVDDELAAANADGEVSDVDILFEDAFEGRMILAADADLELQATLEG